MKPKHQYGPFDRFIHWIMAINIMFTMIIDYGMSALPDQYKAEDYAIHGLSVTTILLCLVIRTVWRLMKGFPAAPPTMPKPQVIGARIVDSLFYVVLFAAIITGILLASTTSQQFIALGYGINYSDFHLVSDAYYARLTALHTQAFWVLVALLVIHTVAVLKHHFIDKDEILINMTPFISRKGKDKPSVD
jgi:cytochrome b561